MDLASRTFAQLVVYRVPTGLMPLGDVAGSAGRATCVGGEAVSCGCAAVTAVLSVSTGGDVTTRVGASEDVPGSGMADGAGGRNAKYPATPNAASTNVAATERQISRNRRAWNPQCGQSTVVLVSSLRHRGHSARSLSPLRGMGSGRSRWSQLGHVDATLSTVCPHSGHLIKDTRQNPMEIPNDATG